MPVRMATAAEIQAEIQRRIRESDALDGDCKDSKALTPRWSDVSNVHGTHWTIDVIPGLIPGCQEFIENIVLEVMAEYELKRL